MSMAHHPSSVQPCTVPRFEGLPCEFATAANITTGFSCPHEGGYRSYSVSIFTIKDAVVSTTLDKSLASPKTTELPSFFVFASNQTTLPPWRPGRGSGFFKSCQYPVIVPKSHILLEAFMLLFARDLGKRVGGFALSMIGYIEEYVDEDGYLEIGQVSEPLVSFYKELKGGQKPVRQWAEELKAVITLPKDSMVE
ncbi:hypothetical protein F5884DRAFT_855653 [Xylogone sp. PMI_703]|nr:hypothetical protein F5884DRAFT_855653 [Xylogone sp. PMI_703]